MTHLYFPVKFNGNLRFFLCLNVSLSQANFLVPCEFEIERVRCTYNYVDWKFREVLEISKNIVSILDV